MTTATRWQTLWHTLRAAAPPEALYGELVARYGEPHRHYHTLRHLGECLAHFDGARQLAEHPAEVELALWFHDAIYEPRREDNEARSAEWARRSVLEQGLAADVAARIHSLVMATRHRAVPEGTDAQLLVDVDLAILGAAPGRFDEYEAQVGQEYAWVPRFLFGRKRRALLEELLARPSIYSTAHFRQRLEAQARDNLRRSIDRLA